MAVTYLTISNGIPQARAEQEAYQQDYTVSVSTASGTAITLPASETYNSTELFVLVNNVPQDVVLDYTYVGTVPRTQVSFTYTLNVGDVVTFRKVLS